MHNYKKLPGIILILIMVLTIGGAFVCFGENNRSFAVGENNAQSVDAGEAENKDESTDEEQAEEPEAADDVVLSDRVIEAEVTEAEIYINGEDGKKHSSEDLKSVRTFWKSLTSRTAKLAENSGQERKAPVEVTVSGKLPDDVKADIRYIEFDEDKELAERALFAFELTFRDADGNVYIPEEPVTVTVSGTRVTAAVKNDRPVLVYSYAENTAREEEYAKTLSQDIYAADVLVYRDGSGSDEQLAYEKYDENKEYKDGKDAVRYTEDKKGLAFTEDEEAVFDYEFSSDEEADAVQDGSARFVMSEQKSAEELSKEKASDPDEKKTEKSETKSGKDSDKDGAGPAKKAVGKTVTASDNRKYKITASYGPEAGLPADIQLEARELKGLEYRQYRRAAAVAVGADKLEYARVFDITLVDRQGKEYQPDDNVSVTIELLNDKDVPNELTVVHFDEKKNAEVLESETSDEAVSFDTDGFSVYAVISTVISETLTASDGKHYKVTVEYDSDSGIPSYAKLKVSEIDENSDDYKAYIEETAKTLGTKKEKLAFARALDIKLVNPLTGRKYQPGKDVRVSIELLDQKVSSDEEIRVIHFGEKKGQADSADGSNASEIECGVKDGTIDFDTDGFSVFVLTKTTYLGTYQFYSYNSFGDYQGYNFFDDQGNLVTSQIIKNGETLLAPHDPLANPNDPGAEFKGWYVGTGTPDDPQLEDEPFDFDTPQDIKADETINLYAVFSKFAHVTFHSQYDNTSQTDPVLEVMPVELTSGAVTVDISDKTTSYYSTSGNEHYEFYGWSLTPFHTAGQGTGEIITNLKNYEVSEDIDLYPVYRKVNYLTLTSGYTGTSATYYSPVAIPAGETLTQSDIKNKYIPNRPGYIFKGWYLDVEHEGTINQNGTGTQVTEEDGTLKFVSTPEISTTTGTDGYLQLSTDVTLYARWESTNVDYKIIVWRQRKTDAATLPDKDKTWDYAESFVLQAKPYDEVTVAEDYKKLNVVDSYNTLHPDAPVTEDNNPYNNYSLNSDLSDTSEEINYEGTTVFNLYYDWTGSRVDPGTDAHTLTFMNGDEVFKTESVSEGALLKNYYPADPPGQKQGYEFHWYLDSTCTTQVSDTTTMPNHPLSVYAGWEKEWYLIQIDPNFGSLNGNGSTYFWKSYKSDYIQEYTWVTRDYVESDSGNFYYVNHDYDYVQSHGGNDRQTYYTTRVSDATSLTTYKQEAGTYLYDGWYQVNPDGTETPYIFGELITGNTKLKLHWKKSGTYYLKYNTDVTIDGERLIGTLSEDSVLPDTDGYRDQSDIRIGGRAVAPESFAFVGWTIRGDDSGKVYYPGEDFKLLGEHAVTVNGKKTVYLDAVYKQIKTAKIVYDANGGTITDSADGGYPYEIDSNRQPVLDGDKPKNLDTHTVTRDSEKGTVTVSGLVNNSPVKLSSGEGFTAPPDSGAELAGWNTKADGSGSHYDIGAFVTEDGDPICVDIKDPVTLYAEWKIKVYFNKNDEAASFSGSWEGYTLVEDSYSPHYGEYFIEKYVNATLEEPAGTVTNTGTSFDFWSKKSDGDQSDAFSFDDEKLKGEMTLYAHFSEAVKIHYHVASINKVKRDSWRKTDKLRVTSTPLDLTSAEVLSGYVTPDDGYSYSYACLSHTESTISEDNKITEVRVDNGTVKVKTSEGNFIDLDKNGQDHLNRYIYLVYTTENTDERVKLAYVREGESGALSNVVGAGSKITYDGSEFDSLNSELVTKRVLNSTTVANGSIDETTVSGQVITLSEDPLEISQAVGADAFNAPPLLDEGNEKLALIYDTFGVSNSEQAAANISDIVGSSKRLYLRYYDGKRQWSGDKKTWTAFTGDTLYVVYRPRGVELEITKAIMGDNTGISEDESFAVNITSTAITRTSYAVEGTGYSTVPATPASGETPGSIDLTVKDGSDIRISGLGSGDYTVTETHNSNYILNARIDNVETEVTDNRSVSVKLDTSKKVDLLNQPQVICQILDTSAGEYKRFYTLNKALEYAGTKMDGTAVIEMMRDYSMPAWDVLEIPTGYDITLTKSGTGVKTITRTADTAASASAMLTNYGTLTLKDITFDGESIDSRNSMIRNSGDLVIDSGATLTKAQRNQGSGSAIYQTDGTLTIKNGASFTDNSTTIGGAIYVYSGTVNIEGGTFSGNTAVNDGGVLYYAGNDTVTISGGTFSGNHAANGNGGAIYAPGGYISITGCTFSGNTAANGSGGAICSDSGEVSITGGTLSSNAAKKGGAVYSDTGEVIIDGGTLSGNAATSGNGGAICSDAGTVVISKGTLSGNAANGNGGAVYSGRGSFEMSGGTIGGSGEGAANTANNGAAVFKDSESATFTGGTITGNTATAGGAVGVGSADARLNFSGDVIVNGNKRGDDDSNIYLDKDADNVINITGLGKNASIGVYVADSVLSTRGVPGAKFATYTEDTNTKTAIKNDRDEFSVVSEASAKKLFWGKAITVIVRYQKTSYADQLPPAWPEPGGDNYKTVTINNYYPVMGDDGYVAVSALTEDLYTSRTAELAPLGLSATAAYGGSWLSGDTYFGDYVTKLTWNAGSKAWELTKHDDTTKVPLEGNDLIVYYAEPAYISIENNTDKQLTISGLTLKVGSENKSVINTDDNAGYGMVYAKNGAIRSALLPVESGDLVLEANKAISLLIPGGRNMEYSLTGKFAATEGTVKLRTTKQDGSGYDTESLTLGETGGFIFPTGKRTLNKAGTYQIIFGDDKMICKIYTDKITDVDPEDFLVCTVPDSEGKVEYVFKSLNQATSFVQKYMNDTKTATIEMLIDYLLPASDNMNVPQGYNIALTTAESGTYKYVPVDPGENRATISRDSENKDPLVAVASGNNNTFLTVDRIIIDGKSVQGKIKEGVVSVKNAGLIVRDSAFKNVYAENGGAIFAECGQNQTNSWVKVYNSDFTNCHSTKTGDRDGGGAIHAYVNFVEIDGCNFDTCDADWQAGAIFHKVENNNKYTESYVKNCTFTNCRSKAAGGMELGSRNIIVMGCTFTNCVATSRNGGGFNVYALKSGEPTADCWTTVIDCDFIDCHNTGADGGRGGGFRCTSKYTTIINTDFTNTSAILGGAVALSNKNAESAEIYGGIIDGGVATNQGGGLYCLAKSMKIGGSYTYKTDENGKPIIYKNGKRVDEKTDVPPNEVTVSSLTTIKNCTAKNAGGGIFHENNTDKYEVSIANTAIQNCVSTNGAGGGIRSNSRTITVTGSMIQNNRAKGNGGGICSEYDNASYRLTVDSTEISGNVSGGIGGGIYNKSQLTLRNGTKIIRNRLTGNTAENAAGVYVFNNRTLTVGTANADKPDATTVINNTTASGAASDLRLAANGTNNAANSVSVLCDLNGEIRVVNPGAPGTQFGTRANETITGFTEGQHVFIGDAGDPYGVYDRNNPKNLIWRGNAICKLTDASGHLLYLDEACTDPAVFDRLDYRSDGNKISPFSYLRQDTDNITLYRKDGSSVDLRDDEIQIRMLVGTFESATYITTTSGKNNYSDRKLLTLTTAGSTDTDGYPYTGRAGSYATVTKGYTDNTGQPFIKTGINLTLKNITLDGGSADRTSPKTSTANGGLINAETSGTTVTLSSNAVLQNCSITNNNSGAGVYVDKGASLVIAGGAIYNCSTAGGNGGAVWKSGDGGKLEFTSGIISNCSALNGGGVYFNKGSEGFRMSGTAQITGCTAANEGGGVWLNEQKTMTMEGGSITANHAGTAGGGVFLKYHKNTRLNLSGRVTVSGNNCGDPGSEYACNVQLGTADNNPGSDSQGRNEWNGIINSTGISRNSYIGIYVPGEESPDTVFDRHGIKEKPFGTYSGDTNYLYCFVNDRNGLKGGLMTTDKYHYIYWVEIFSLKVGKTVISGEPYDLAEEFKFKVTFSATEGGAGIYNFGDDLYFYYDDGRTDEHGEPITIPINNGVAKFTLKTGDKVTVDNLPAEYLNGHIFYSVEEELTPARAEHYTTTTSRSTNPSAANVLTVKGIIGENLDRTDVSSKYISNAFFDNLNAICKLTSSKNGGVLLHTLDTVSGNLVPAIYTSLHNSSGSGAFDIINASTTLYYWNAFTNKYEVFNYSGSDILSVEMLVGEHKLPAAVTLDARKTATFTTADRNARDGYPYVGSGTTASIIRDNKYNGSYMFTANGNLTLKNICLDGNNLSVNKGIISVPGTGSLTVTDGATLKNSVSKENGGAVMMNGGTMTMTGGTITGNKTTGYGGGAIRMEKDKNSIVTISGGEISNNEVVNNDANGGAISVRGGTLTVTGGNIINNKVTWATGTSATAKTVGGAIYIHSSATASISGGTISGNTVSETDGSKPSCGGAVYVDGGKLTLSGGKFNGNTAARSGAGIYLNDNAKLYISGNPVFGDGTDGRPANLVSLTGYSGKKNGNESVYSGNTARQDIYITETGDNPASIEITGNLTGDPGSIWVWAESEKHYKTLTPFAKIDTSKVPITDTNRETVGEMFKVFRNAQPDDLTENPLSQNPAYLYGILKTDDNDYVYWYGIAGKRKVILRKVGSNNDPSPGHSFTIKRGSQVIIKDVPAQSSGIIWIGELPYGEYTIEEKNPSKSFIISVEQDGIYEVKINDNDTRTKTKTRRISG